MSVAANLLAFGALLCFLLSAIGVLAGMFSGQRAEARHQEYQMIGWLIATALLWLAAK